MSKLQIGRSVKRKAKVKANINEEPILYPDAAGIDLGAREIYVAVPPGRSDPSVRKFGSLTPDLHQLVDWLIQSQVKTVAMEATGVYWIPLFQILEARGLEVFLVNAYHVKNVRGRKSDVSDCQWLQQLHRSGLLAASFRPDDLTVRVRSLLRHRDGVVSQATEHIQRMQKAFNEMNIQLHHVLSDITGTSGRAIIEAILEGQRDPHKLADLRDPRVKTPRETIIKALTGDWRSEQLFTLQQNYAAWQFFQTQVVAIDQEIQVYYGQYASQGTAEPPQEKPSRSKKSKGKAELDLNMQNELIRIVGVDLTAIPGISTSSARGILSEVGLDMSRWKTVKHFAAWLGLCPNTKITGGKVIGSATRKVKNRAAQILRICAWSLSRSYSELGDFYRRMRARLGAPKAITALAHKLARIIYHMLSTREAYDETRFKVSEEEARRRHENRLKKQAQRLGFQLVPVQP